MSKNRTEERYPLLLYFIDSNQISNSNKRFFIDKDSRIHRINSGATAIIAKWPNHMSICWIATLASSLLFFITILLLIASSVPKLRMPRCTESEHDILNNNTIHLVHGPEEWNSHQFELMESIIKIFPNYKLHLLIIHLPQNTNERIPNFDIIKNLDVNLKSVTPENKTSADNNNKIIIKNKRSVLHRRKRGAHKFENFPFFFDEGAKRLIDILFYNRRNGSKRVYTTTTAKPKINSVHQLIDKYPDIILENTTWNVVFESSPLYSTWPLLNDNMKIFAARVLQLWQHGGVSFDLKNIFDKNHRHPNKTRRIIGEHINASEIIISSPSNLKKIELQDEDHDHEKMFNLIVSTRKKYESLPLGVVTADDQALHMETRSICHAFFGEILMNLRRSSGNYTVRDLIRRSLEVFCTHSSADQKYCKTI